MDCIVHGVTKTQTQLRDFHFHFTLSYSTCVYAFYFYLFLAVLGLRGCSQVFSGCGERGCSLSVLLGLLIAMASLVAAGGL